MVLSIGSAMPGQLTDPLEHLWIMRWTGSCLAEGRSPFFCPGLNCPTGVPLGYFPTMHVQTAAFLAMGLVTENDVVRFNVLWFSGFVASGLGTFVLAWWAARRVDAAWLAGLGMMLSGPMMMHAHGHLETMQMGAVPVFLIGWIRFVDRPGIRRLLVAGLLYLLVVACAPYFAVLAVFPAAWYFAWKAFSERSWRWLGTRTGWLACFGALVLPGLVVLFSSQVWAAVHQYPVNRPRSLFDRYGAPVWSSFAPSRLHGLGVLSGVDLFEISGYSRRLSECSSYLGVVTLALLSYAAIGRVRFPRAGYWWSALALMVVLSWGSHVRVGAIRIGLPAGWIYGVFPPFHLIRVPARFNLFAAVCAAVPASAAAAELLGRIGRRSTRLAACSALVAVTLADLAMVPFESAIIPPMPRAYRDLTFRNPGATLVDAPTFGPNEGQVFSSLWGYWQSTHRAGTTAGYPGIPNVAFEDEVVRPSPFWSARLKDPGYLAGPASERFGVVEGVDARDYARLYLAVHKFDHVVLHQGAWFDPAYAAGSSKIKALLADALAFEDADVAVFDRARLGPPVRLAWIAERGFRPPRDPSRPGPFEVLQEARVAVEVPSGGSFALALRDASATGRGRDVRLRADGREVARWSVGPGPGRTLESPPFRLEAGRHSLALESDGEDPKAHSSWRVNAVRIRTVDGNDR